jgi:hypothetical protein
MSDLFDFGVLFTDDPALLAAGGGAIVPAWRASRIAPASALQG